MSTNIKIPDKHYVGLVKRRDDNLPLGFMTPWGEDKAARDRMATVDRWATAATRLEPMVIDNQPMSGFRLTKSIRTTNYGGHDHWRVEDPRGFELEITSGNLAQLLSVGILDRGDILDECVWARHGKDNVLLSTSTEEYRNAVENTRVAGIKSNWRDAQPGNRVVLQNNIRGQWLGRMYTVYKAYNNNYESNFGDDEIAVSDKTYHFILSEAEPIGQHRQILHVIANPKLSYIESDDVITTAAAESAANQALSDRNVLKYTSGYQSTPMIATFDRPAKGTNLVIELMPLGLTDPHEIATEITGYDRDMVLARRQLGGFGIIKQHYSRIDPTMTTISEQHLQKSELRKLLVPSSSRSSYLGRSTASFQLSDMECPLDQVLEFYKLQLKVTTAAGNVIGSFLR